MTDARHDAWPAFWFAPWRWAHADWSERYGVSISSAPAGVMGQRLLFRGWIGTFGLDRYWAPPADARWLDALAAPSAMMREAAAVLGWIAIARAQGARLPRAADPTLLRALRYREVSCVDVSLVSSGSAQRDAAGCGLLVLRSMAEAAWPDVAARVAMMQPPAADAGLVVKRVDVARCLTLWLAALRWLRADDGRVGT